MKHLILVVILLMAGMSSAQAQRDERPDASGKMKERILRIADKLEFSQDQRLETRQLLQGSFADIKVIREEMGTNRGAMKSLAESHYPDV